MSAINCKLCHTPAATSRTQYMVTPLIALQDYLTLIWLLIMTRLSNWWTFWVLAAVIIQAHEWDSGLDDLDIGDSITETNDSVEKTRDVAENGRDKVGRQPGADDPVSLDSPQQTGFAAGFAAGNMACPHTQTGNHTPQQRGMEETTLLSRTIAALESNDSSAALLLLRKQKAQLDKQTQNQQFLRASLKEAHTQLGSGHSISGDSSAHEIYAEGFAAGQRVPCAQKPPNRTWQQAKKEFSLLLTRTIAALESNDSPGVTLNSLRKQKAQLLNQKTQLDVQTQHQLVLNGIQEAERQRLGSDGSWVHHSPQKANFAIGFAAGHTEACPQTTGDHASEDAMLSRTIAALESSDSSAALLKLLRKQKAQLDVLTDAEGLMGESISDLRPEQNFAEKFASAARAEQTKGHGEQRRRSGGGRQVSGEKSFAKAFPAAAHKNKKLSVRRRADKKNGGGKLAALPADTCKCPSRATIATFLAAVKPELSAQQGTCAGGTECLSRASKTFGPVCKQMSKLYADAKATMPEFRKLLIGIATSQVLPT